MTEPSVHITGVCITVEPPDRDTNETAKCPHHRGIRITVEPPDTDTKGTTKCPHHRGVCIRVKPPNTETNETEPSVWITEESVLQSNLLIQTPV